MIEREVECSGGGRVTSAESGDEELSLLPRHTKVIVTGNNRTKSVLVGLHGVVKKAVGLGGWHWLVLKNGIEVKLQRNALSVLEPPNGNEDEEEDDDFDRSSFSSDLGQHDHHFACMEFHKVRKPRVRHTRPWAPSAAAAKLNSRNRFKEFQSDIYNSHCSLNFTRLGSESLWRYLSRFQLGSMNSSSREQMVNIVQRHFVSQHVDEVQVIAEFTRAAKRLRNGSRCRE